MQQCKKCLTMKHIQGDVCERCKDIKTKIYQAMDTFLVEAKDQNGNERTLERLNADRHLFVEKMEELFETQKQEIENLIIKEIRIAQQENTKTSRLTSLLNNIMDL